MKRVLVIGDLIADVYRDCTYRKQCPDAPDVPAVVHRHQTIRPGGAANVALNIAALSPDCIVDLMGITDQDIAVMVKALSNNRVGQMYCYSGNALRKERTYVDGKLVLRVDNYTEVDPWFGRQIVRGLKDYLKTFPPDLIVLSEYAGGTVNDECLAILLEHKERLMVDTKRTDLSVFDGCLLIKLNDSEWSAVQMSEAYPEKYTKYLIRTVGEAGSTLYLHQRLGPGASQTHTFRSRAHQVPVVDVCGCGDTFMAGLAASVLTRTDDMFTAMQFANAAAATVVIKERTAVADRELTLKLLGRDEK